MPPLHDIRLFQNNREIAPGEPLEVKVQAVVINLSAFPEWTASLQYINGMFSVLHRICVYLCACMCVCFVCVSACFCVCVCVCVVMCVCVSFVCRMQALNITNRCFKSCFDAGTDIVARAKDTACAEKTTQSEDLRGNTGDPEEPNGTYP